MDMEEKDTIMEDMEEEGESAQKAALRRFWDATSFIIVPVVVVFLLFGILFALAWVPTGSMEPTLPTKSHFIGLRLPYLMGDPVPDRGDIVMFRNDEMDELMVKRVIGLPGDEVLIGDGYVYVNGEQLEEPYLPQQGITFVTGTTDYFAVPEGCIFLMGDNRTGSYDSRAWGQPFIELEKVKARAVVSIAVLPQCTWKGIHFLK